MAGAAHLRVYRLEAGTSFEGGFLRALEETEPAGRAGILDALFVARDAASGEVQAVDLATGRADGTIATLLDFRLDPGSRHAITDRTLTAHAGGVPPEVVRGVAAALEPGGTMLAVLVAGDSPAALEDAVSRSEGRLVADEPVAAATLAEVASQLRSAL